MAKRIATSLLAFLVFLTSSLIIPSLACQTCQYKPPPPATPKPCPPPPPPKPLPCPPPPPEIKPTPSPTCPIDTLKLSACVDLLAGLVHVGIGSGAKETCCPVIEGLADLDAALCLCTTIKAKLLDVNVVLPIALQVLVGCGKNPPKGYQC